MNFDLDLKDLKDKYKKNRIYNFMITIKKNIDFLFIKHKCKGGIKKLNLDPQKKSPLFIVSLTSYDKRVYKVTPYALHSLFNQTEMPDKIVLWLDHSTKIHKNLKRYINAGLEIKFCDDLKSYKKLIPSLTEYPNDVIITTDDDIYYDKDWFKLLKESYLSEPKKIHCHVAHEICLDENKQIIPYVEWRRHICSIENAKRLFPTGNGGILYPPKIFIGEIMNIEKFQHIAPTADDIWFWAMAHVSGCEYKLVKNNINKVIGIGYSNDKLTVINVFQGQNDEQIKNIIKEYPKIYESIL